MSSHLILTLDIVQRLFCGTERSTEEHLAPPSVLEESGGEWRGYLPLC